MKVRYEAGDVELLYTPSFGYELLVHLELVAGWIVEHSIAVTPLGGVSPYSPKHLSTWKDVVVMPREPPTWVGAGLLRDCIPKSHQGKLKVAKAWMESTVMSKPA